MKKLLILALTIPLMAGCKPASTTTPPTAVAPGYTGPADQTLGQDLAALNGFVSREKINYQNAAPAIQAAEKTPLNAFVTAVDLANAAYTAYHTGTQTLAQAQAAVASAQNAQSALVAAKGVK